MDENHDFPAKMLCLAVRKEILEEPLCARFQNPSSTEEITDTKGGVSKISVEIFFCVRVRKSFKGESFCASQKFWYRKKDYLD